MTSPYVWIEYKVNTVSEPDRSHLVESSGTGSVRIDCKESGRGTSIVELWASVKLDSAGWLMGEGYANAADTNQPNSWTPGSWCLSNDKTEAYCVSRTIDYDPRHGGYGWGWFEFEYTKCKHFEYHSVTTVDWNTIVRVHLTEQTGQQFKKYPLVE